MQKKVKSLSHFTVIIKIFSILIILALILCEMAQVMNEKNIFPFSFSGGHVGNQVKTILVGERGEGGNLGGGQQV